MENEAAAPETSANATTPVAPVTSDDQVLANLTQSVEKIRRELGYDQEPKKAPVAAVTETVGDSSRVGRIVSDVSVCPQLPPPASETKTPNRGLPRPRAHDTRHPRVVEQRRIMEILLGSIGSAYADCTLDSYEIYDEKQRHVVEQLRALNPKDFVGDGGKLFFYGPSGTGKDHLANSLMLECARNGMRSISVNARTLCSAKFEDAVDMVKDASRRKYAVVTVSDPAPRNDTHRDWLYEIIEERNKQRLSTWLTINVATREEGQELLSPAVFGRFRQDAQSYYCNWADYRLK